MMTNQSWRDGAQCPSGCGGSIFWSISSNMYICEACSEEYAHSPLDDGKCTINHNDIPAHKRQIAYIAGALNAMSCDYLQNVRRMILWAEKIRELGYAVFIPGIDLLCGIACDDWNYNVCFNNSQPFLAKSDIVFVCPKWEHSEGTAKEIKTAKNLSIPIYYGKEGYEQLKLVNEIENLAQCYQPKLVDDNKQQPGKLPYMRSDEGACDKHVAPPVKTYIIKLANSLMFIADIDILTDRISICTGQAEAKRFTKVDAVNYIHSIGADLIIENLSDERRC